MQQEFVGGLNNTECCMHMVISGSRFALLFAFCKATGSNGLGTIVDMYEMRGDNGFYVLGKWRRTLGHKGDN